MAIVVSGPGVGMMHSHHASRVRRTRKLDFTQAGKHSSPGADRQAPGRLRRSVPAGWRRRESTRKLVRAPDRPSAASVFNRGRWKPSPASPRPSGTGAAAERGSRERLVRWAPYFSSATLAQAIRNSDVHGNAVPPRGEPSLIVKPAKGSPELDRDLLYEAATILCDPAVRVDHPVEDLLALLQKSQEPSLFGRCRHSNPRALRNRVDAALRDVIRRRGAENHSRPGECVSSTLSTSSAAVSEAFAG
jgi:hypothetical protein